jgi:hypothetical protein
MRTARNRGSHKHFQLDALKIRRAQKVLRAKTETETIERALDAVIAEHKRDQPIGYRGQRTLCEEWHRSQGCVRQVGQVDGAGSSGRLHLYHCSTIG